MNAAASRSCTGVLVGYVAYVLMINWGRSWSGRCPVGKYHMYIIVNTVTQSRTHSVDPFDDDGYDLLRVTIAEQAERQYGKYFCIPFSIATLK